MGLSEKLKNILNTVITGIVLSKIFVILSNIFKEINHIFKVENNNLKTCFYVLLIYSEDCRRIKCSLSTF